MIDSALLDSIRTSCLAQKQSIAHNHEQAQSLSSKAFLPLTLRFVMKGVKYGSGEKENLTRGRTS